jgi:hypothetical protein
MWVTGLGSAAIAQLWLTIIRALVGAASALVILMFTVSNTIGNAVHCSFCISYSETLIVGDVDKVVHK